MKIKASVSFGPQRFFIRLIKAHSSISPLYLHLHEPESTHSTVWQYHFQPSASLLWSVLISRYRNIANVHGEMVCYYDNLRFIFFSNGCGNGWGSLGGGVFGVTKEKDWGRAQKKKKDWEEWACPNGQLAPSMFTELCFFGKVRLLDPSGAPSGVPAGGGSSVGLLNLH